MLRRQKPGEFHNYPEHRSIIRRLMWTLGFDPLTVYERLEQVRAEAEYWEGKAEEAALRSIDLPAPDPRIDPEVTGGYRG
jgi:hypothetical protein